MFTDLFTRIGQFDVEAARGTLRDGHGSLVVALKHELHGGAARVTVALLLLNLLFHHLRRFRYCM